MLLIGVATFMACKAQTPKYIEIYSQFRDCIGDQIIYSQFDPEEAGEYPAYNLIAIDTQSGVRDTILQNSIYWAYANGNNSKILVSDGIDIFNYNLETHQKTVLYSLQNKESQISKIIEANNLIYFIELDYGQDLFYFNVLNNGCKHNIYSAPFSEYSYEQTFLKLVDKKLVCQFQFYLCFFDLEENLMNVISTTVDDVAVTNTSIIYSYINHNYDPIKKTIGEYDLNNNTKTEFKDLPFIPVYKGLYSRQINGINQVYYYEGMDLYLYNSPTWVQENKDDFLIFKNRKIEVFLHNDVFYFKNI